MMANSINLLEQNNPEPETIDTRFGKILVQKQNAIYFSAGLLGMPDKISFFLAEFPNESFNRFKILQSLNDYSLAFITMPVDINNEIISIADLQSACVEVGIKPENLAVVLIVSVHRSPEKVSISVNARAPILIDASTRLAAQYVFKSDKYQVQHYISL